MYLHVHVPVGNHVPGTRFYVVIRRMGAGYTYVLLLLESTGTCNQVHVTIDYM